MNLHPMTTKSKNGISKPKLCYKALVDYTQTKPLSYRVAYKFPQWVKAMDEEFSALQRQKTWSLVPTVPGINLVGCKWVYKLKLHSDGTIARYKARLVVKGFHQQIGVDYSATFSLVVKLVIVRLVLSIAVSCNWPLRQLDVSNAFFHGFLKEEVYIEQPPGYMDQQFPHHICRLHKSLYGLKQAPKAWFDRFTSQLLHLGFEASMADSSLFVFDSHQTIIYLFVYIDDIIITGNSSSQVSHLVTALSKAFELKDLGTLSYYLGIQIVPSRFGLTLY